MIRKILRFAVDLAFLPLSIPLHWFLDALQFEGDLGKLAEGRENPHLPPGYRKRLKKYARLAGDPITDRESWKHTWHGARKEIFEIFEREAAKMESEEEIGWPQEVIDAHRALLEYFNLEREKKPPG